MLEQLINFNFLHGTNMSKIFLYPPNELYGSIETPTPKEKKAEKRITDICEVLYRFDCSIIGDFRMAKTNFDVAIKMMSGCKNVKISYLLDSLALYTFHFKILLDCFSQLSKKDPILKDYYKDIISNIKIKDIEYHYITIFNIYDESSDLKTLFNILATKKLNIIYDDRQYKNIMGLK